MTNACVIYFILKKEKFLFLLSKYFHMMSNDYIAIFILLF
jgi:hypothetical protein